MTLDHVEAVFTKRAMVVPALVQTHLPPFRRAAARQLPALRPEARFNRRSSASEELGGGTGAGGGVGRGSGDARRRRPAGRLGARRHHAHPRRSHRCSPATAGSSPRPDPCCRYLAILSREAGSAHRRELHERHAVILVDGTEITGRRRDRAASPSSPQEVTHVIKSARLARLGSARCWSALVYMVVSLNRWEWNRAAVLRTDRAHR